MAQGRYWEASSQVAIDTSFILGVFLKSDITFFKKKNMSIDKNSAQEVMVTSKVFFYYQNPSEEIIN